MQEIEEKIKDIKLVVTDVDGVLTDGGLFYTREGLVMKRFNVKDGMATRRLKKHGIECGIITTDIPDLIEVRNQRMKTDFLVAGTWDKLGKLREICSGKDINLQNVAYIGDDVNDLEIINAVGLSAAPADAVKLVLNSVDYVCKLNGGDGVFREFVELILEYK